MFFFVAVTTTSSRIEEDSCWAVAGATSIATPMPMDVASETVQPGNRV